jgi:uncharacterized phage protein (TIGR01671 family)
MREIKFRAWDKNGKKYFSECCWLSFCPNGIRFMWIDNETDNMMVTDLKDYELMQYTGLKDKNGKEIWEGDICRVTEEYHKDKPWVAEVAYVQSGFCFVNRKCCSHCAKLDACICTLDELIADVEIIGNIYENKELI